MTLVDGEDSTNISNLSRTTRAVVCYSDRLYKNDIEARTQFPQLQLMGRIIALAAATEPPDSSYAGDGVDTEPRNLPPMAAAVSIKARLDLGHWRPVGYADLSDMHLLISDLHYLGVPTPAPGPGRPWRVFTAHPTGVRHLCGPHTCGGLQVDADATQWWWSSLQNPGGLDLDKDVFRADFFKSSPLPPLPPGVDPMSLAITTQSDGNILVVCEAEAPAGKCGEVFGLWTTQTPGSPDTGPVWHGEAGKTSHKWVSLGTPGK